MKQPVISAIEEMPRAVFTTKEIAAICGVSVSSATQSLSRLAGKGIVVRAMKGLWARTKGKNFTPLALVPYLSKENRSYVSFVSALHIHGVIGQVPQTVTVASTAHSGLKQTPLGNFRIHKLAPSMMFGYDWSTNENYLIATPEKALIDCLYISMKKGRKFGNFPELDVSVLDQGKLKEMIAEISDLRIRKALETKLKKLL